jgi:small subunit ribosomal protein S17
MEEQMVEQPTSTIENTEAGATVEASKASKKGRIGRVVSNKMNKTIVVAIERKVMYPMYGKFVKKTKKYHVHDERQEANMGDTVRILETRPLSKTKRFRLVEIIERAK